MLSRIGNSIIANNQRRMFDRADPPEPRLFRRAAFLGVPGAADHRRGGREPGHSISRHGAIGRDLLSLIGSSTVMVVQDPVMSLFAFFVAPPAFYCPAQDDPPHLHHRQDQFTGGTRILETMQETLQGIRIVKAFTLEDAMRARLDDNVAELEQESNKLGARRPSRRAR